MITLSVVTLKIFSYDENENLDLMHLTGGVIKGGLNSHTGALYIET